VSVDCAGTSPCQPCSSLSHCAGDAVTEFVQSGRNSRHTSNTCPTSSTDRAGIAAIASSRVRMARPLSPKGRRHSAIRSRQTSATAPSRGSGLRARSSFHLLVEHGRAATVAKQSQTLGGQLPRLSDQCRVDPHSLRAAAAMSAR